MPLHRCSCVACGCVARAQQCVLLLFNLSTIRRPSCLFPEGGREGRTQFVLGFRLSASKGAAAEGGGGGKRISGTSKGRGGRPRPLPHSRRTMEMRNVFRRRPFLSSLSLLPSSRLEKGCSVPSACRSPVCPPSPRFRFPHKVGRTPQ